MFTIEQNGKEIGQEDTAAAALKEAADLLRAQNPPIVIKKDGKPISALYLSYEVKKLY